MNMNEYKIYQRAKSGAKWFNRWYSHIVRAEDAEAAAIKYANNGYCTQEDIIVYSVESDALAIFEVLPLNRYGVCPK